MLGPRGRTLFHFIIFFGVALAMGVFVLVIAKLLAKVPDPAAGTTGYSTAAMPSALLMVVALVCGYLLYKRRLPLLPVVAVGFLLELAGIWLGMELPTMGVPEGMWPGASGWMWILLAYAFAASVCRSGHCCSRATFSTRCCSTPGGAKSDPLLLGVGSVLLMLGTWLLVEAVLALRGRAKATPPSGE